MEEFKSPGGVEILQMFARLSKQTYSHLQCRSCIVEKERSQAHSRSETTPNGSQPWPSVQQPSLTKVHARRADHLVARYRPESARVRE